MEAGDTGQTRGGGAKKEIIRSLSCSFHIVVCDDGMQSWHFSGGKLGKGAAAAAAAPHSALLSVLEAEPRRCLALMKPRPLRTTRPRFSSFDVKRLHYSHDRVCESEADNINNTTQSSQIRFIFNPRYKVLRIIIET